MDHINSIVDVLLVNPPRMVPQKADFPPIGLAYISETLKKHKIASRVVDACTLSWKNVEGILKYYNPSIVGIPCWTIERNQTFKLADLVAKTLPHAKIIVGGHHATSFPEHMFKMAKADAVVMGEGEETTVELVKALLERKSLSPIKGIAFRENENIVINEPREFISDMDSIPFPSYEEFDFKDYLGFPELKEKAAALITSRGCIYNCIFCSATKFWKQEWRARSSKNVLREVESLYKNSSIRAFMFFDDNFTVDKKRVIDICQGILEKGMQIKWVACSHVNKIDSELLSWMRKAGCYRIDYGVESGSPKVLRNIRKGQTVETIRRVFRETHEAGIKPRAYLMVGNPGEDETTIKQTISLVKDIKPYDTFSGQILWVLPDTEIYELAKEKELVCDDDWLKEDPIIYYTAEHSLIKLMALRDKMMRGLLKDNASLDNFLKYFMRKVYYSYPILQKLRKYKYLREAK